jgi:hypothetical protein
MPTPPTSAKSTAKLLDPFAAHDAERLKARGLRVVKELVEILEHRAESENEAFADQASKLSEAWQAVMLVARVALQCEEGTMLPEILGGLPETDDRTLVLRALKEMGEGDLAKALSQAEELVDEDPRTWASVAYLKPPEGDALLRLKKKLFVLIGSMSEPFPAARG